jgi:hypothetical protein
VIPTAKKMNRTMAITTAAPLITARSRHPAE